MDSPGNWRPVVGWEDLYLVSDKGEVRSLRSQKVMVAATGGAGYLQICLTRHGKQSSRYVHILVLEAFVGPRPPGLVARHLDDREHDNRLSNLAWGTRSQNGLDAVRNGVHGQSKKTHCPQGHPYDAANTFWNKGTRYCRTCRRIRSGER